MELFLQGKYGCLPYLASSDISQHVSIYLYMYRMISGSRVSLLLYIFKMNIVLIPVLLFFLNKGQNMCHDIIIQKTQLV